MSALTRLMPPVQHAKINGTDIAYYEAGPREGSPVVLCHGFPEIAFSWRNQIKALAEAGRWVIALDQRGYGLSGRPEAVTDYDIEHLTGDLAGLLDHLGAEKAVFCGHDWGAIVVWQMALWRPERCAGIVSLNNPFFRRGPVDPVEGLRRSSGEDHYVVFFQKTGEADALLAADVGKTMRFILRGPDAVNADIAEQAEGEGSPFALENVLKRYDPATDASQFLPPEEMAVFVEMFERSGFTGPLNWYRNFTRNWERSAHLPTRLDGVPCLMLMAEKDAILTPALTDGMEKIVGDLEKVLIKDAGHWTQQEQPGQVNRAILDWLDRRLPQSAAA